MNNWAYDITHLTLGKLLHYLGKLQIHIFCRYSADMAENANIFSDDEKMLLKQIIKISIHSYMRRKSKISVLNIQFVCIFFHIC